MSTRVASSPSSSTPAAMTFQKLVDDMTRNVSADALPKYLKLIEQQFVSQLAEMDMIVCNARLEHNIAPLDEVRLYATIPLQSLKKNVEILKGYDYIITKMSPQRALELQTAILYQKSVRALELHEQWHVLHDATDERIDLTKRIDMAEQWLKKKRQFTTKNDSVERTLQALKVELRRRGKIAHNLSRYISTHMDQFVHHTEVGEGVAVEEDDAMDVDTLVETVTALPSTFWERWSV